MEIKNKDDLMKAYPDMVNEIRKDAAIDAINRERARIKDIQDMTLPGMEQTMQDALYGEHPMDSTAYAKEVAKAARSRHRTTSRLCTMTQRTVVRTVCRVAATARPTFTWMPCVPSARKSKEELL